MRCPVCDGQQEFQFTAEILRRHQIKYFRCGTCGLLQTETPYWLDEAYDQAIAETDTGLVRRNLGISMRLASLLYFMLDRNGRYVDAAGGYGLLTRLMRDTGFDFYWSDKYCANVLAKGFDVSSAPLPFRAATAFEVMEHVHDPLSFLRGMVDQFQTRTIIFSTTLFEGAPPQPGRWWYYALETGQHISFYQRKTLQTIAEKLGMRLLSHGWFHMLTDHNIGSSVFSLLSGRIGAILSYYVRMRMGSKVMPDHDFLLQRNRHIRD